MSQDKIKLTVVDTEDSQDTDWEDQWEKNTQDSIPRILFGVVMLICIGAVGYVFWKITDSLVSLYSRSLSCILTGHSYKIVAQEIWRDRADGHLIMVTRRECMDCQYKESIHWSKLGLKSHQAFDLPPMNAKLLMPNLDKIDS